MDIIALDLATEMGVYTGDGRPYAIKFEKETRSINYWAFICEKAPLFDVVVFEDAIGQRGHALEVFHEFKSLTKLACDLADTVLVGVSPAHIKKVFTGNGRASKEDVIEKCLSMGLDVPSRVLKGGPDKGKVRYNDNAADAAAIYHTFLIDEGIDE